MLLALKDANTDLDPIVFCKVPNPLPLSAMIGYQDPNMIGSNNSLEKRAIREKEKKFRLLFQRFVPSLQQLLSKPLYDLFF